MIYIDIYIYRKIDMSRKWETHTNGSTYTPLGNIGCSFPYNHMWIKLDLMNMEQLESWEKSFIAIRAVKE